MVEVKDILTSDELDEVEKYIRGVGTSTPDEKQNVHKFLHDVADSEDTTKTGFLTPPELGMPVFPLRTNKELAVYCSEVADMDYFSDYFNKVAEITTATSLSKEGFLIQAAVTTKRQIEDITKPKKENKGWFKSKDENEVQQ